MSRLASLFTFVLPLVLAASSESHAQSASHTPLTCPRTAATGAPLRDSLPDLGGLWDFRIDMGQSISTGHMALGHMDGAYAGALTPDATTTVVIRKLTIFGDSLHMAVASAEGDVLFDGRLMDAGDVMCGVVTYHKGAKFTMIATRRSRPRRA